MWGEQSGRSPARTSLASSEKTEDCRGDNVPRGDDARVWGLYIGGFLSQAAVTRVLSDDNRGAVLWLGKGAPTWRAATGGKALRDIPLDERPDGGYPLIPHVWERNDVIIFQPLGCDYSIWHLTDATGKEAGQYINFERRHSEPGASLVLDHELDLVIDVQGTWRWKDEDHFDRLTDQAGYWDGKQAARIRQVVRDVARGLEPRADQLRLPGLPDRCAQFASDVRLPRRVPLTIPSILQLPSS